MTVFRRDGSPNWMIEFQYLGQKVRESSGTTSKTKAKAKDLEQQWRREIHDRVKSGKAPTITLGAAIDDYYEVDLKARPNAKSKKLNKDLYVLERAANQFRRAHPFDADQPGPDWEVPRRSGAWRR